MWTQPWAVIQCSMGSTMLGGVGQALRLPPRAELRRHCSRRERQTNKHEATVTATRLDALRGAYSHRAHCRLQGRHWGHRLRAPEWLHTKYPEALRLQAPGPVCTAH